MWVEDAYGIPDLFWCPKHDQNKAMLACPTTCEHFPCRWLKTQGYYDKLKVHPGMDSTPTGKLEPLKGRKVMYIIKKKDGTLTEAPADFSLENPGIDLLDNVLEVYKCKVYVPVVTLKPKPESERQVHRPQPATQPQEEQPQPQDSKPRRRRRTKAEILADKASN